MVFSSFVVFLFICIFLFICGFFSSFVGFSSFVVFLHLWVFLFICGFFSSFVGFFLHLWVFFFICGFFSSFVGFFFICVFLHLWVFFLHLWVFFLDSCFSSFVVFLQRNISSFGVLTTVVSPFEDTLTDQYTNSHKSDIEFWSNGKFSSQAQFRLPQRRLNIVQENIYLEKKNLFVLLYCCNVFFFGGGEGVSSEGIIHGALICVKGWPLSTTFGRKLSSGEIVLGGNHPGWGNYPGGQLSRGQ